MHLVIGGNLHVVV